MSNCQTKKEADCSGTVLVNETGFACIGLSFDSLSGIYEIYNIII